MDKQSAFFEYKKTEDGVVLEGRISEYRDVGKNCKAKIKDITRMINASKAQID